MKNKITITEINEARHDSIYKIMSIDEIKNKLRIELNNLRLSLEISKVKIKHFKKIIRKNQKQISKYHEVAVFSWAKSEIKDMNYLIKEEQELYCNNSIKLSELKKILSDNISEKKSLENIQKIIHQSLIDDY